MKTQQDVSFNLKESWPFVVLTVSGAILNFLALFTENSGALVAIGCSLIAIGCARTASISKLRRDH